jgi:hypothetical protein
MGGLRRRVLLAGLLAWSAALAVPAAALDRAAPRALEVTAYPLKGFVVGEPDRRVFGRLTFLGGLELRARDPDFGGISSLRIARDGERFIAVTDQAHWITGRIATRDGAPAAIAEARIAPILGPAGTPLKRTRHFDTEALAWQGNTLFVATERAHDILRFELPAGGMPGRGRVIEVPAAFRDLEGNRGIEALAVLPPRAAQAGQLLAFAERAPARWRMADHVGFILGPGGGRVSLRRIGDYDVTDIAFLPDGDLLVLERRFVPILGLGLRIRRIALAAIRPGARLDGEILIEADGGVQIDNMEALAAHRDAEGRTILTIVSDNNFSILQRTLLLRFALQE